MTAIDVLVNMMGIPTGATLPEVILYASALILVVMVADEIIDIMHLIARSMFFK